MITRCLCHSWFSFSSMSHVQRYTVMSVVWFPEEPGTGRFCPSISQKDSASSRPDSKCTMSKSWGVRLLGCLPALVACCTLLVCVHEHLLEGTRRHKQLNYVRVCSGKSALDKKGRASQTAFQGADGEQTVWVWFCWATSSVCHLKPKTNMWGPPPAPTFPLSACKPKYMLMWPVTSSFSSRFHQEAFAFSLLHISFPIKSAKQIRFVDRNSFARAELT